MSVFNNNLNLSGELNENVLKTGIDLVMSIIDKPINTFGIDNGTIYFGYDKSDKAPYYLPIVYDNVMVFETAKRFLDNFEPCDMGGDGSVGKGFQLQSNPDFNFEYLFSIKFKTQYYGK